VLKRGEKRAMDALRGRNKLRSFLTLLGVIFGG